MARVSVGPLRTGGVNPQGFYFQVHGLDKMQRNLEDLAGTDLMEEMEQVVEDGLKLIKRASQDIVPYDTGELHDSAYVSVVRSGGVIEAVVGYDTPYAVYVHEDPDAYHEPPTQWKFLEEPFVVMREAVVRKIQLGVTRLLKKRAS